MPSIALKLVAIITMFIDHLAAGLGDNASPVITGEAYSVMRGIGRTAFPLFCFMITEGFIHTRSRLKYFKRLAIFCLVSEFPFDYIFNWYYGPEYMLTSSQNVFFTLTIGLAMLIINDYISRETAGRGRNQALIGALLQLGILAGMGTLADLLSTDYGADGVLLIAMIWYIGQFGKTVAGKGAPEPYSERMRFAYSAAAIALWFIFFDIKNGGYLTESYGFLSVLFVLLYNGKKGPKILPRGFFYVFYPAHLFIIGMIEHMIIDGALFTVY